MKAEELKKLLKENKLTEAKIEKIILSTYKKVSKDKKADLDNEILAIVNDTVIKKDKKAKCDFDAFKLEVETFLYNAYERYYFIPNKVIPKKNRSSWRFKVMGYVKTIKGIGVEDENYIVANRMLLGIFDLLSYACAFYTFNTNDAFASIGINQCEFFKMLCKRMLQVDRSDNTLIELIYRATSSYLDRENLHLFMMYILISNMHGKEELLHLQDLARQIHLKGGFEFNSSSYDSCFKDESDNNIVELIYLISLEFNDPLSELDFFMDKYKERDTEVSMYVALRCIDDDNDEDWISVYEYITKKYKIDARKELKEEYKERKNRLSN